MKLKKMSQIRKRIQTNSKQMAKKPAPKAANLMNKFHVVAGGSA